MSDQPVVTSQDTDNPVLENPEKLEKYLTFNLDKGVYGLETIRVKEIIGLMKITKIPRTPGYVRGVINLRGQVIPVVDLRVKFGIESIDDTDATCIIVFQIADREKDIIAGVLVDSVAEVLDIDSRNIKNAPSIGSEINTEFIDGIGKIGDKVVIILDIKKTFDFQEVIAAAS